MVVSLYHAVNSDSFVASPIQVLQMAGYASRERRHLPGPSDDEFGPSDVVLDTARDVERLVRHRI